MSRLRRDGTSNESRVLYAVALDGQKVTFECKRGHRSTTTYPERGPRGIDPSLLRRFAGPNGSWRKDREDGYHGHCYGACRACDREESGSTHNRGVR